MEQPAPILCLYGDLWAHISLYLEFNSLLKLRMIGCRALHDYLKAARRIKLEWKQSDYLDLYRISRSISSSQVQEISIKSHYAAQLAWYSPSVVHSWPKTLTRLDLNFFGSIYQILLLKPLYSILPHLKSLILHDEYPHFVRMPEDSIHLRDLPLGLEELRLCTDATTIISLKDIWALPPSLRILWLEVPFHANILPPRLSLCANTLPADLEVLALKARDYPWEIQALPSHLREFHLFGLVNDTNPLTRHHILNMDALRSLESLKVLNLPNSYLQPRDFAFIPPTVTTLNFSTSNPWGASLPPHVSLATKYLSTSDVPSPLIMKEFTNLVSLQLRNFNAIVQLMLPSTLISLRAGEIYGCCLPERLEELYCISVNPARIEDGHSWTFPPNLTVLSIKNPPKELISAFPSTLKRLSLSCRESLPFLSMHIKANGLPSLVKLSISQGFTLEMIAEMGEILPVMKEITLESPPGQAPPNLSEKEHSALDILKSSSLTFARLEYSSKGSQTALYAILKNLPTTCKNLSVRAQDLRVEEDIIVWPQRLVGLKVTADQLNKPFFASLPSSLRTLDGTATGGRFKGSLDEIPPHLSFFSGSICTSVMDYYRARKGPLGSEVLPSTNCPFPALPDTYIL